MSERGALRDEIRNLLSYGDLSFRDFVELALYHPQHGYYSRAESPVGERGDFITAPAISPVFSFALGKLVHEFLRREDGGLSDIVDIGCGDAALIHSLATETAAARFWGVDRFLGRVPPEHRSNVELVGTYDEVRGDGPRLVFSNELFDALPFTRLVQRGEHLHELWVAEDDGVLDWREHEAAPVYDDYFARQGVELLDGQFADISLEWEALYADILRMTPRGLVVTFDYGFPRQQLFDPRIRRFGTAAAYAKHRVSRDLLADPGEQDLTAHINFSDLIEAGERAGFRTIYFGRQAAFLLALGITEHELFAPSTELEVGSLEDGVALLDARDQARRLVLPDGIGEDIRVLVQARGVSAEPWPFEKPLY